MKKVILVLLLCSLVTMAYANPGAWSIGGGIQYMDTFDVTKYQYNNLDYMYRFLSNDFGGLLFVDFAYLEFSARLSGSTHPGGYGATGSTFGLGLFAKYPFMISYSSLFFPLLGLEYNMVLSVKDEIGEEITEWGREREGPPILTLFG